MLTPLKVPSDDTRDENDDFDIDDVKKTTTMLLLLLVLGVSTAYLKPIRCFRDVHLFSSAHSIHTRR